MFFAMNSPAEGPYGNPAAQQQVPPKIRAAFTFLEYIARATGDTRSMFPSAEGWQESEAAGRRLTEQEKIVYKNALMLINSYFQSPGFGDTTVVTAPDNGPADEPPDFFKQPTL